MEALNSQTPKSIDRPSQAVLERILTIWQKDLATSRKAQSYVKGRGLWHPELLRSLRVGYSSGKLPQVIPANGKLKHQLEKMGLLNERGNEFFYNRLVVPLYDEAGVLVNVYGRTLTADHSAPHLYLPGPRRGVFNLTGIREASAVILAESILDAISLHILGFRQTTASFGVTGFTTDLQAALMKAKTGRVYCVYDADPAGDHGAEQLAHDLANHGIEVLRVTLPCKDPNDFLKGGGTRSDFQNLLDQAQLLTVGRPTSLTPAVASMPTPPLIPLPSPEQPLAPEAPSPARTESASADSAAPVPATDAEPGTGRGSVVVVSCGPRRYEVVAFPRLDAVTLRVRLKISHEGRVFLSTLNLYADQPRAKAVSRIAALFGGTVRAELIEKDFFAIIEAVEEAGRSRAIAGGSPAREAMPAADETAALELLRSPNLVERIRQALTDLGVVGENRSKLLVYLVATSRRLEKPLSIVVVSRSSAGKSYMVNGTLELFPEEETLVYTRVSPKAFFHDESERLKHKTLVIEEAQGMEEANYALRVMQSSQCLRSLSTITNPETGEHEAQETVVQGPVALIVTTTQELDFETISRAFVISVDESIEQTAAIHERQRIARTLDGFRQKMMRAAHVKAFKNAQRLLKPVAVVNNFAPRLTFPTRTLRLRREHDKYLTLIEAITYLFQYQRSQGTFEVDGTSFPYVETAPADIDLANELIVASLRQAFDDITSPARELLRRIREMIQARQEGNILQEVRFTRREIREYTEWPEGQMRTPLEQLETLELIHPISGSFGKQYIYLLSADHHLALPPQGCLDDEIRELGLTRSADLVSRKG
jgi:DNA primase